MCWTVEQKSRYIYHRLLMVLPPNLFCLSLPLGWLLFSLLVGQCFLRLVIYLLGPPWYIWVWKTCCTICRSERKEGEAKQWQKWKRCPSSKPWLELGSSANVADTLPLELLGPWRTFKIVQRHNITTLPLLHYISLLARPASCFYSNGLHHYHCGFCTDNIGNCYMKTPILHLHM